MVGKNKITILTGAGLSRASGIPTFKGDDLTSWTEKKEYAGLSDPTKILTKIFFEQNPMAVWEWYTDFIKLANE